MTLLRAILLACCCAAGGAAGTACAGTAATPGTAPAATASPAALTAAIEAQFRRSAAAWNRGDLDAFMADYVHDSTTTYVARGHLRHGWDAIRAGYAPRFAPGARRDSLHFEDFAVRPLGADYAAVFGRFVLSRGDSVTSSGPFTLVMQRRPDGWKILHDHSSSD
ncbi:MAG TPA: nuclear transport factor 2 family protein [Gemmatimonadales bacterium]|nr:nuclear transport factor 2 family protein [Gemmatimonadales bacterium]